MYEKDADTAAVAQTSSLNEELGQVSLLALFFCAFKEE